jgi:hypothetical protein
MRRILGYMLLILGLLLIFLAPLIRFYTFPRVQKVPTDVDEKVASDGAGSYLRIKDFNYIGPVPLTDIQTLKGLPDRGTHDISVIDSYYDTKDAGKTIDYIPEVFVLDRKTGLPVHCCGELPRHEGYTLKLPFDTQKTTYQWWDSTAKRAFPAKFVREQTIDDLTTYQFESKVDDVVLDPDVGLPGSYVHEDAPTFHAQLRYAVDTNIWVEPTTGALIKGSQHGQRWFADPATGDKLAPASDTVLTWTPRYVQDTATDVTQQAAQLKLVKVSIPVFGPVIGLLFVIGGILLVRRRARPRPAERPARKRKKPTAQPAAG